MNQGCYVYLLRAGAYAKIGIADDIPRRVAQLQTACPERIVVESFKWVCCRAHALQIEAELHDWPTHAGLRTFGEWFKGGIGIESYFEYHYGHRVSLCQDSAAVAQMAKRFVGVPMVLCENGTFYPTMYPIGSSCTVIAPASDYDGDTLLGYALTPDIGRYVANGWYSQARNALRIVLFDGTWSETDLGRWYKAIRYSDSIHRNETRLDSRFLLTDGRNR